MPTQDGPESGNKPGEVAEPGPLFKWDTLREVEPYLLRYKEPIHGQICEVELTSGRKISVFRAQDGQSYFCHGLTFGSKDAPGGAVSPFSGEDVRTILEDYYRLVEPESNARLGILWSGGHRQAKLPIPRS